MFDTANHKCKACGLSSPEVSFYIRKGHNGRKPWPSPKCKECDKKEAREAKKTRYHDPVKGQAMKASAKIRTSTTEYKAQKNLQLRTQYAIDEVRRESIKKKVRDRKADPSNKSKIKASAAARYQRDKDKIIRSQAEKRRADPKIKLRGYMRGQISEALKICGSVKGGVSSLHYLDYTWDDLYRHLESQFDDWMNFSNRGIFDPNRKTWQVDHIIPQVFFPYQTMDCDLFRWCWSLHNLRPLDSQQNFQDGNREDLLGPPRSILDLFQEIREFGIPNIHKESVRSIFESLRRIPAASISCNMLMYGLSYLDTIFLKRFASKTANFPSVNEAMQDNQFLLRVVTHLVKYGHRVTPGSVFSNMKFLTRTPGHFFPSSAASVIKAHLPNGGTMFDPFLGWGGRTLGAICSGVSKLTGCDLQPEVIESCKKLSADFASESTIQSDFILSDSLKYMIGCNDKFDLIFTSPPFMDTEDYGIESDAMRHSWIDDFVFPFAEQCRRLLSPDGTVALHLKDLKGAPTFTAYHSAMKAAGFIQKTKYRYGRTWTQAVYIYQIAV